MSILQELLYAAGLTRVSAEIMQAALLSIRLKAHAVKETPHERGASRFGGEPDLPQGFAWPEANGSLLPFVAQINLLELASYDSQQVLPTEGILYFFFDIDAFFASWPRHQGTWRVFYNSSAPTDPQRVAGPGGVKKRYHYHPSAITYATEITLPDYSRYDTTSTQRLGLLEPLTDEEEQAYNKVKAQLAGTTASQYHLPIHRLLGYSDNVQWDMHRDLPDAPTDWQLLFQIDSDDIPGTEWGDTGRIYYWISAQDLAKRDFARVELILQST